MFGLDPEPERTAFARSRQALLCDLVDWLHTKPSGEEVDEEIMATISALGQMLTLYQE